VDADWDQKLQQTMVEMFPLKSADAAYGKISGMVSTLGDPFTKIISPKVYILCVNKEVHCLGSGLFSHTLNEMKQARLVMHDW
jgi:hypothetical protein